jgi:multidrug transporter EmrE-like cation transporter
MISRLRIIKNIEINLLFLIFLMSDTATQLFLKIGATDLGDPSFRDIDLFLNYLKDLVSNFYILTAIFFVIIAFASWLAILSKIDLSKAQIINSFVYVTVPIASIIFLKENIEWTQMIGIICVSIGAFIAAE